MSDTLPCSFWKLTVYITVNQEQLQQNKKSMETAFSWYYYSFPHFIYATFPLGSDQINDFGNPSSDFQKVKLSQNHDWFGNFYFQQENQPAMNRQFKPIAIKSPQIQNETNNSQQELSLISKKKIYQKNYSDLNQYFPLRKSEENKVNSSCLNEYRNILPNTIHQILSYVQRKNKSKAIVQRLIKKYQQEESRKELKQKGPLQQEEENISMIRYYAFQSHLKNKLPNYVTLQTFKLLCTEKNHEPDSEIFSIKEQKIYNKICRTVILYYLKFEVVCVLMASKRMQKDKKREHLKTNRRIENYIRSGFKEQINSSDFCINEKTL